MLRRHLRLRRVLSVSVLTAAVLPLLASAASASVQDPSVGRIGDAYDPDPLTGPEAWAIYGGTIVGGFLLAIILTVLSSRGSSTRYRPGQPWDHDEVWIGKSPEAAEGDGPRTALPGSGGTSGSW